MIVEPAGADVSSGARSLDVVVASSPDRLTVLRRMVRELAVGAGASPALTADLELVVSELATNVIRHTRAPSMAIAVRVDDDHGVQRWSVSVGNDVQPVEADDHAALDVPPGGRGLRIVAAVMDDISVSEVGGRMTIRATLAVTPSGGEQQADD